MATTDSFARCLAGTKNVQVLAGMMAREGVDVAVGPGMTPSGVPFTIIVAQGLAHERVEDIGRRIAEAIVSERLAAKLRAERS